MAYNLRTNEILLHGKFQPPNFNGVAVHRSQTEVQTKRGLSNICLDPEHRQIHFHMGHPKSENICYLMKAVCFFIFSPLD